MGLTMEPDAATRCPRCNARLTAERIEEPLAKLDTLRCDECQGRFLDPRQLEMIEETVEPTLVEIRRIPTSSDQQVSLPCPVCPSHPVMEKFEHHRDHKVVLDRCRQCRGIWLDGGELRAIREESLPVFLANTVQYFWEILRS
ncbi:MAG: zf-TFIIB domain-containing protein [Acidobacteriota bacterium]